MYNCVEVSLLLRPLLFFLSTGIMIVAVGLVDVVAAAVAVASFVVASFVAVVAVAPAVVAPLAEVSNLATIPSTSHIPPLAPQTALYLHP